MAHQSRNGGDIPGLCAGADLQDKQFYLGVIDTNGDVVLASTAGAPINGVITNKPNTGQSVTFYGPNAIMKVVAGGNIPVASQVTVDANGKAAVATAGDYVFGTCLEAAAAADELCSVHFHGGFIKA